MEFAFKKQVVQHYSVILKWIIELFMFGSTYKTKYSLHFSQSPLSIPLILCPSAWGCWRRGCWEGGRRRVSWAQVGWGSSWRPAGNVAASSCSSSSLWLVCSETRSSPEAHKHETQVHTNIRSYLFFIFINLLVVKLVHVKLYKFGAFSLAPMC